MVRQKFWKSVSFWITFTISLITIFFISRSVISNKTKYQNSQFSTLSQNTPFGKNLSYQKLLAKSTIILEFKAKYNNLGEVEVLFNNYGKINTDHLIFRIKDNNSNTWYYQNVYPTSLMDSAQFFPFGFPIIEDSKDKSYLVEIESVNGKTDDSVSLSTELNFFQSKYLFTKSFLMKNKRMIPSFLVEKVDNYIDYFSLKDIKKILVPPIILLVLYFLVLLFFPNIDKTISDKLLSFKKDFIDSRLAIPLVIFYLATRIQFLNYSHYWDAAEYWYFFKGNIDNFRYAIIGHGNLIKSFIENFNILGHPSMGYISLMSISQFISRGDVVLFNIENLILASLAILAFYKIVKYFFPDSRLENLLITFIFAFNPLFFATSISFNLDFPVLVFEVLMIEALFYKKSFWFIIWSVFLIFSKETGVLVYFAFVALYFLFFILKRKFDINKKNIYSVLPFIIPSISFLVYILFTRGRIWSNEGTISILSRNLFSCKSSSIFCFKLSWSNINTRLSQIFIMNFSWISSLIILVSLLKSKIKSANSTLLSKEKLNWFKIHVLILIFFVVFNLIFFVMPFPRYVVAAIYFTALIFYVSVKKLFPDKRIYRVAVLSLISFLTFVQVFKSIDPTLNLISNSWKSIGVPDLTLRDAMVYNSQFAYLDNLEKKVIEGTNNGPPLIISEEYYFKNIKTIGTAASVEKFKKAGLTSLNYVYFPWATNREESLKKISKFYRPTFLKTIRYRDYYVEIYSLKAI